MSKIDIHFPPLSLSLSLTLSLYKISYCAPIEMVSKQLHAGQLDYLSVCLVLSIVAGKG